MLLIIFSKFLVSLITIVGSYALMGLLGTIIPLNTRYKRLEDTITCYIISNGVHTDFLVPIKNSVCDWTRLIDVTDYSIPEEDIKFMAFGWGDRGFYLEIPRWADLTPKIAANAMLIPSPTLMHVTAHKEVPEMKRIQHFSLNIEKYRILCDYIHNQFRLKGERPEIIEGVGYSPNDNFYHARGSYHAFNTCNYWVNKGLQKVGVRTSLWSPWDRGMFYHLGRMKSA